MGERGPKPAPPQLQLLRGNPGKKAMAALLDDVVRPEVGIPECPPELEAEGRAEWDRITPHLQKLGLISELDRAALTGYCAAWQDFCWATQRIQALNAEDPNGERGRIWDTPSGYKQISVPLQIRNRALEQMEKFLAHFGLSPALRSRVTPSDPQLGLPGVDTKPAAGGWGGFK
jgi:P27 family predicted phage terminase small subunit